MAIIGVDAGATWIKAGRFSSDLTLADSIHVPSGGAQGREAYIAHVLKSIESLGPAERIGIAVPGLVSRDNTTVRHLINIAGESLDSSPLTIDEVFKQKLPSADVTVINDANSAAFAEWQRGYGGGDVAVSLLHVTWGTGIGTGYVVHGVIQYGWSGGHLPLEWNARGEMTCHCGSTNDLEALVAVPHLVARAKRGIAQPRLVTSLTAADFVDVGTATSALITAAEKNDVLARQLFDETLTWFARGLLSMSVLAYPQVVTIGGGMMASEWLLNRLREHIEREAVGYTSDALKPDMVHRAKLGNEAGMMGAALLASQPLR